MKIENNVIVSFDPADKHLTIPQNVVGMDYFISDMMSEAVESIVVEEGNKHFYMQDGCLIWRDKKAVMFALPNATIPADGSVTSIAGGAFMHREELTEIEIPASIKEIRYGAFSHTGLKKVTLNEGLKFLDAYAFGFNDHLKELAIPKSVKKIVTYDVLEEIKMLTEYGYRDKVYHVYKNSRAYVWARKNGLKMKLREEDKK
jgi:hypothetical protein